MRMIEDALWWIATRWVVSAAAIFGLDRIANDAEWWFTPSWISVLVGFGAFPAGLATLFLMIGISDFVSTARRRKRNLEKARRAPLIPREHASPGRKG